MDDYLGDPDYVLRQLWYIVREKHSLVSYPVGSTDDPSDLLVHCDEVHAAISKVVGE